MNDDSASVCDIQIIQIVTDFEKTLELTEQGNILALSGILVDEEIDFSYDYTCLINSLSGHYS